MRRREFLAASCVPLAAAAGRHAMTVRGAVDAGELGLMLPHEHVMSLFGAEPAEKPVYDEDKLFGTVVPYLKNLYSLGCRSIADCTTAWFGRAPALLKRISEQTGLHILTNTGYYAAAGGRYLPEHARRETAGELAARWLREWREGIEGTGIRPGFVKLGFDAGPLSDLGRKLVAAAARVHLESGLVLAVHTGDNPEGARGQLAALKSEGVSPQAWIWVHAHSVKDEAALAEAADAGAWLEFDGIAPDSVRRHLALVEMMKRRGALGQVLLSHDGNSFRALGRPPKPYDALFTYFVPALEAAGYSREEIRRLTVDNPRRAFTAGVRRA